MGEFVGELVLAGFEALFEGVCGAVGRGVLKIVTAGRYAPPGDDHAFGESLLGLGVIVAAVLASLYLLS